MSTLPTQGLSVLSESDASKGVINLASNQVEEFRKARDAHQAAVRAGANKKDVAVLKAAADAKKALTPGGRGMD